LGDGNVKRVSLPVSIFLPQRRQSFSTELWMAGIDFLWEIMKVTSVS
jgi:hypothetical protein